MKNIQIRLNAALHLCKRISVACLCSLLFNLMLLYHYSANAQVSPIHNHNQQVLELAETYDFKYAGFDIKKMSFETGFVHVLDNQGFPPPYRDNAMAWLYKIASDSRMTQQSVELDKNTKLMIKKVWPKFLKEKKNITINAVVEIKNGKAYTKLSDQGIHLKFDTLWILLFTDEKNNVTYLIKTKMQGDKDWRMPGMSNELISILNPHKMVIIENEDHKVQFRIESFVLEDNTAKILCNVSNNIQLEVKSKLLSQGLLFHGKTALVTENGDFKFTDLNPLSQINTRTYDSKINIFLTNSKRDFIIGEHWGKNNPLRICRFNGSAMHENLNFKVAGEIIPGDNHEQIAFKYDVNANISDLSPLYGYKIKIINGNIHYSIIPDLPVDSIAPPLITGLFIADITLPKRIYTANGSPDDPPIILKDVKLEMKNYEGYSGVANPPALRIGKNFMIRAIDNNAVFYFKDLTGTAPSHLPNYKDCFENLSQYREFEIYKIPGLTIYHGEFGIRLYQVQETNKLHTLVWGYLNLQPNGIFGELSSQECSVLPYDQNFRPIHYHKKITSLNNILLSYNEEDLKNEIENMKTKIQNFVDSIEELKAEMISQKKDSLSLIIKQLEARNENYDERYSELNYYLEQLMHGPDKEVKPREPEIIYHLNSYQILNMKIEDISFCSDTLATSSFIYDVHFPYPSYLDMKFSDRSLDRDGYFHNALGPIYPMAEQQERVFRNANNPLRERSDEREIMEIMDYPNMFIMPSYEITGNILWFWRIPINIPQNTTTLYFQRNVRGMVYPDTVIISKCFLDLPLLHSDYYSDLGYKVAADMNGNGIFRLTDYDRQPFFGKHKAKDYRTSNIVFELTSLDSLPYYRSADFWWNGDIRFPFFDDQNVNFTIRNLEPSLKNKISPVESGNSICDPNTSLRADGRNLDYIFDEDKFISDTVYCKMKVGSMPDTTMLKRIEISSYIIAKCLPHKSSILSDCQLPNLTDENAAACRTNIVIKQTMKNCIRSDEMIDLIFYDEDAHRERGNIQANNATYEKCGYFFMRGDYIIEETNTDDMTTTTTLFIPNATIYYNPANDDDPEASNDFLIETDQGIEYFDDKEKKSNQVLNIPGAIIINDAKHLAFQIGFPVTSDVGGSLPYNGSVSFSFNKQCGTFWFYGDGKFYFILDFEGQIFIMHCPFSDFTMDIEAGIDPLGIIQKRLHLTDSTLLKEIIFPAIEDQNTIMTGVLLGADVSFGIEFLDLSLGAAVWSYYQGSILNKDFTAGINIHGAVSMNLIIIKALASLSLSTSIQPGFDPEIDMSGDLYLCLIESLFLAHMKQTYTGWVVFSNKDGFDYGGSLHNKWGKWGGSCK
jgi:hypothetical protein